MRFVNLVVLFMFFSLFSLSANEQESCVYLVPPPIGCDYISGGESRLLTEKEGVFNIESEYRLNNGVSVNFYSEDDDYSFEFYAPKNQDFTSGIYKNARRFPFNASDEPGLDISGNGRGCNRLKGEFEVLEVQLNKNGEFSSLAVNFLQRAEEIGAPLVGTLRYNSDYPIANYFSKRFKKTNDKSEKETIYVNLTLKNFKTDGEKDSEILNSTVGKIKVNNLIFGVDRLDIQYDSEDGTKWSFIFSMPVGEKFKVGFYDAKEYSSNFLDYAGIAIESSSYNFSVKNARYSIFEFVKNKEGGVESIAVTFNMETDEGLLFQGEVIYNSGEIPRLDPQVDTWNGFETTSDFLTLKIPHGI